MFWRMGKTRRHLGVFFHRPGTVVEDMLAHSSLEAFASGRTIARNGYVSAKAIIGAFMKAKYGENII